MSKNTKATSKTVASKAAKILSDSKSSQTAKKCAASVLSQSNKAR